MIVGQEKVAELFGVAPKTIVEWQEQGFPVAVRGGPGVPSQYDGPACIRWLVDREVRKVQAESPKDRLARVQAERIEMDMAKERRQLVPAAEIEPLWSGAVLSAREFLRAEPARIAGLAIGLDRAGVEQLVKQAFDEFLTRLSTWRPADDADDTDTTDDEDDD